MTEREYPNALCALVTVVLAVLGIAIAIFASYSQKTEYPDPISGLNDDGSYWACGSEEDPYFFYYNGGFEDPADDLRFDFDAMSCRVIDREEFDTLSEYGS